MNNTMNNITKEMNNSLKFNYLVLMSNLVCFTAYVASFYLLLIPYNLYSLAYYSITFNIFFCCLLIAITLWVNIIILHLYFSISLNKMLLEKKFFIIIFLLIVLFLSNMKENYIFSKLWSNVFVNERLVFFILLFSSVYINYIYLKSHSRKVTNILGLLLSCLFFISSYLHIATISDLFKYYSLSKNSDFCFSGIVDLKANYSFWIGYFSMIFLFIIRNIQINPQYTYKMTLFFVFFQLILYVSFFVICNRIDTKILRYKRMSEPKVANVFAQLAPALDEISKKIDYNNDPAMLTWRLCINNTVLSNIISYYSTSGANILPESSGTNIYSKSEGGNNDHGLKKNGNFDNEIN